MTKTEMLDRLDEISDLFYEWDMQDSIVSDAECKASFGQLAKAGTITYLGVALAGCWIPVGTLAPYLALGVVVYRVGDVLGKKANRRTRVAEIRRELVDLKGDWYPSDSIYASAEAADYLAEQLRAGGNLAFGMAAYRNLCAQRDIASSNAASESAIADEIAQLRAVEWGAVVGNIARW